MTGPRWRDPGLGLGSFGDLFLVVCPRCGRQAQVARSWNAEHRHWRRATMTCGGCGLARRAEARLCCDRCPLPAGSGWVGPATLTARCRCQRCGRWLEDERRLRVAPKADWVELRCAACACSTRTSYQLRAHAPGEAAAVDRCFGLPLWLQTPCAGDTLWAWNSRHLAFLREYLAAGLREHGSATGSAAARLPGWLKRTGRATALRAIGRLERRALAP